jgi:hypothetical protein
MSRRTVLVAAVATILSAVYAWVPSAPANAAGARAVANVKMKEASKLRVPGAHGLGWSARTEKSHRDLGKYNRMFEMY